MKVYVASSWRNEARQQAVVNALRAEGHEVYDFRNPPGATGFSWAEVDPDWQRWTPEAFRAALSHQRSVQGFANDMRALQGCDACVLVQPCGRSAHLELGWASGAGKKTVVLLAPGQEAELMLAMADEVCTELEEVLRACQNRPVKAHLQRSS